MSFVEFHFLRPWWFLALLPGLLLLVYLIKNKRSFGNWAEVCDLELLPFLLEEKPFKQNQSNLLAAGFAGLLTIIALAGPTWQRLPSPAFRNEAALVIALDLSASMDATDIKPSRIAKARYKIADLLKKRKDGQTALLVYGGDAFTVTPLTMDVATIGSQLEALTTDIMPSPGRNTGIAIRKAVNLLQQAGAVKGHILLVTDGVDSHSAASVEQDLAAYHLSILGVGTSEGAPIRQSEGGFVKDSKGGIVIAHLDSQTLSDLAEKGKGVFQTVTPGDEDVEILSQVFNTVTPEDNTQDSNLLLQQWDEKGPWLVLLVLPWAALRFRKGLLLWLGLCLLPIPRNSQALDWQSLWQTPNQQGAKAFEQQQFKQAAEQFDNPSWRAAAQYKAGQYQQAAETLKGANTADGLYNRGNALAQSGQLQEAIQAYQQALKLDPGHQDAEYNKKLVEKKLQEQQKPQDQDQNQADKQSEQNKQDQQSAEKAQQNQTDKQQDKQDQQAQQDKQKPADEKPQPADDSKQNPTDQPEKLDADKEPKPAEQANQSVEKNEAERANEQLLKRIPDEPTGLLKRKFKYQYSQRNKFAPTGP